MVVINRARARTRVVTIGVQNQISAFFPLTQPQILDAMAAAPEETQRRSDSWSVQDSQSMVPGSNSEPVNNTSLPADDRVGQDHDTTEYARGDTGDVTIASNKTDPYRGEKQVKVLRSLLVYLCHLQFASLLYASCNGRRRISLQLAF